MIDTPGDLVWDLPWMQQGSYLEEDRLMWMLPLYLHINQNPDDDAGSHPHLTHTTLWNNLHEVSDPIFLKK